MGETDDELWAELRREHLRGSIVVHRYPGLLDRSRGDRVDTEAIVTSSLTFDTEGDPQRALIGLVLGPGQSAADLVRRLLPALGTEAFPCWGFKCRACGERQLYRSAEALPGSSLPCPAVAGGWHVRIERDGETIL